MKDKFNQDFKSQKNITRHDKVRNVLVSLLILGIGILIGFFIPHQQLNKVSESPKNDVSQNNSSNSNYVEAVKTLIKKRYYKPVDENNLDKGSIKGMLDSLNDPYTSYLDSKEAQSLNETISSSIVGIGITVMEKNKFLVVDSVIDGSPAKKAGIHAKDIIIKVDGKTVIGKQPTEATKLIRGEKGTKVLVTVKRGDQELNFNMVRNTIPIETVKSKMINSQIGLVSVSSFSNPTFDEFKKAIIKLRKEGATKLIIDMRGNPGGELKQALSLSSCFLKDGTAIMQVQGRKKSDLKIYRANKDYDQGFKVKEPSIVLIDGDSASAAEIFTAALKHNKVPVVGTTSFGKGTVQSVVALPDKAELKMTIAKWLTPDG
ncbi:MAG: S41 family peptidase, partial [Lactobacillaceae bacterium]